MTDEQNNKKYQDILNELKKFQQKDFSFSSGKILGSMCTQPHPIAKDAYIKFLETNIGDPRLCPGTKEIETSFLRFIFNLLHAPKNATGQVVSGGTEGNITAMWIVKQITGKREIIIPESAHFSFQKIASLMDMKLISVPLDKNFVCKPKEIEKQISKDTAAVIGIAGSTELGAIDPIPQISEVCSENNIFLHVDAAFGGFVIPFLKQLDYDAPDFDFQLEGVSTISIDSHKMGYAAIPLGTLVIRDKSWIEEISVKSHCIDSEIQTGILGTRSGGPVAAGYAVTHYLGKEGYKKLVKNCMDLTQYTVKRLNEIDLPPIIPPTMNVIGIKLKNIEKVVNKLSEYGWKVNKIDHLSCIRIVLMPQITKHIIDEFIPVLLKSCKEVGEL